MNSEAPRHATTTGPYAAKAFTIKSGDDLFASTIRAIGSLWFAAVLLVMLLVAMACATVFESAHDSPEMALAIFYRAWWFKLLLSLLAVNSLIAMALRFPFSTRQIGFILTHASILVILGGALVSEQFAVNGHVSVTEGQSVDRFDNLEREVITITKPRDHAQTDFDLDGRIFGGFDVVETPAVAVPAISGLHLQILRYIPDSNPVERVADDSTRPNSAVEVSLSNENQGTSAWVFQNESASLGQTSVGCRMIADAAELAKLVDEHPTTQSTSPGMVKIEYHGATLEIPLEACLDKPAPIGDTGYTVHVLRYLPHATVGHDGQIANASDRPVNPFIEAELSGPSGTETRKAFARFPEFSSMHSAMQKNSPTSQAALDEMKLTFATSATMGPNTPIEVLGGPDGRFYARFAREDGSWTTRELRIGEPVETPWTGRTFALVRRYDHARMVHSVEPVAPARKNRTPAILVKADDAGKGSEVWLRKDDPQTVEQGGQPWSLLYTNQKVPLGFKLTLNRFRIGHYPGESAPRSFESHVSVTDGSTGREENKIISMNQPVTVGDFTLFQSSYQQGEGKATSVLSVANDPGQPIVFLGYITMLIGMIVVMFIRMRDRHRTAAARAAAAQRTGQ